MIDDQIQGLRTGNAAAPADQLQVRVSMLARDATGTWSAVGRVEGSGSAMFAEAARVTWPARLACGECERCRGGLSHHCERAIEPSADEAAKAGRWRVPSRELVLVPESLSDESAALGGLVAASCHAMRSITQGAKGFVTIIGADAHAVVLAKLMSVRQATTRLLSDEPMVQRLAEQWSIKHRPSAQAGRRSDQDVVVADADRAGDVSLAIEMLKPRGQLLLIGRAPSVAWPGHTIERLREKELSLQGVRGATRGAMMEGLQALATGVVDAASLVGVRGGVGEASHGPLWMLTRVA